MLLEPIYEQDFYDGSYGFRPGRSAHQALETLWKQTMNIGGGWILEVDIRKFFDTLDHAHLRTFLQKRMRDGVLKRLIGKWLKAGVMEDGNVSYPYSGSPQGSVVSPILSNVFLHYVLDAWFETEVKPRLRGQRATRTGNVSVAGIYPLLGTFSERSLGGEAEDGLEASESGDTEYRRLVSMESTPAGLPAAPHVESESAWSFRVLRDHGQRPLAGQLPGCSQTLLA